MAVWYRPGQITITENGNGAPTFEVANRVITATLTQEMNDRWIVSS